MDSRRYLPPFRMFVVCASQTIGCACWSMSTQAQDTRPMPESHTAPESAGDVRDRLRSIEEMNRKLIETIERSAREHDERLKSMMDQVSDLKRELDEVKKAKYDPTSNTDGPSGVAPELRPLRLNGRNRPDPFVVPMRIEVIEQDAPSAGDLPSLIAPAPSADLPGDVMTPVPDYMEGVEIGEPSRPFFRSPFSPLPAEPETPVPDYQEGVVTFNTPVPMRERISRPSRPNRSPIDGFFGTGFWWQTQDEEFQLRIRIGSQFDLREWSPGNYDFPTSGIYLPRQRVFFAGRITKQIEYELAFNRGMNGTDLLNAYLNYHADDRLEIRLGRYFTPLGFDQWAIPIYWMPTPERSLFTTNVGTNRQVGLTAWGYLFDSKLDYAVGAFNGGRNSFQSQNNAMDVNAYVNVRPFQDSDILPILRYLNFGTSAAYGYQDQRPVPQAFQIGAISPNSNVPGLGTIPFLILDNDVIEKGPRLLGSVHAAYFYKSLSLIGEWQYGYGSYASRNRRDPIAVPFDGFYATAAYFLTGEQIERRAVVRPNRPFRPFSGSADSGPGAWEAVARVTELDLGDSVFRAGFADPKMWSDSALQTEVGVNWYWNEYLKVYMFWLHADFGDPVMNRPGKYQTAADMFWIRFQLFY
jgi:phosphate-selective porin OprO/OprP